MAQSVVFFDMTIGGAPAGRIEMTLRGDIVPKTAEVRYHRTCVPRPQDALARPAPSLHPRRVFGECGVCTSPKSALGSHAPRALCEARRVSTPASSMWPPLHTSTRSVPGLTLPIPDD